MTKTNTNGSKALSSQQMVIHNHIWLPLCPIPLICFDSSHSCHHGDSEMSNSRPGEWSQTVACVTVKEVVLITGSIVCPSAVSGHVWCDLLCNKKMTLGKWSSYGLYKELASLKYFWFGWHLIITDRCVGAGFALKHCRKVGLRSRIEHPCPKAGSRFQSQGNAIHLGMQHFSTMSFSGNVTLLQKF